MATKLTDKIVKTLLPPAKGNRITYDSELAGFGARITAAGAISFVLNYRRKADGVERRATIGAFPAWSTATARERAKELRRDVDGGGDPVGEQQADRGAPTVAELCDRFVEEHVSKKRASTQRDYKAIVAEIRAAIGRMRVAAADFEHIDKLHREITKRAPYRANRTLAVASKMFTLAIRWRWRTDNPCRGVERNQEQKRKRYLSADELVRMGKALDTHGSRQSADIFRFLLLTGARCGEALSATWDQFDDVGVWTKPGATTKQKTDHVVPLSPPARQLLARIRKQSDGTSPYIFPGPGKRGHRTVLKHDWAVVCKAAGITGLRIHDLRHSYASTVISAGWSLPVVGALLGHTQPNTTARYAHLVDDVLSRATNAAGAILSGAPAAPVIPIKGGRREG
jgi:integrase